MASSLYMSCCVDGIGRSCQSSLVLAVVGCRSEEPFLYRVGLSHLLCTRSNSYTASQRTAVAVAPTEPRQQAAPLLSCMPTARPRTISLLRSAAAAVVSRIKAERSEDP